MKKKKKERIIIVKRTPVFNEWMENMKLVHEWNLKVYGPDYMKVPRPKKGE